MGVPNYENCTLDELLDVARNIDREKYPDRYAEVLRQIERRQIDPPERSAARIPARESNPMAGPEAHEFWKETRRRRNHFFLTWIGWIVVGFPLWGLYSSLLPSVDPEVAGMAALFTWGAFWWWVQRRLTSLRCYACGRRAFEHPYFLMSDAKCQNCGVTFSRDRV